MFDANVETLIQFRLPSSWTIPPCIRDLGEESAEKRAARQAKNESAGKMEVLLERHGATLANIHRLLSASGLKLDYAHVQERVAEASEFRRKPKPYLLVTFCFTAKGLEDSDLLRVFTDMAARRWEYLSVVAGKRDDGSIMCVVAKTQAQEAKLLRTIDDQEATNFGIVVSRSIPRTRRPEDFKEPEQSRVFKPTGDNQLDRLLQDGWRILEESAKTAVLVKDEGEKVRTMTHHKPKKVT